MQISHCGYDFVVEYEYSEGWSGTYWEPPEPPEFYLTKVKMKGSEQDILEILNEDFVKDLEEKVMSAIDAERNDYYEPDEYYQDDYVYLD